jgi:hypothetical protein
MSTNGHSNGTPVLERVRALREQARRNGEDPPGRDTLVRELEVPVSQIREALAIIRHQESEAISQPAPDPIRLVPAPAETPTDGDTEAPPEPAVSEPRKDSADDTDQPGASSDDLAPAPPASLEPPLQKGAKMVAWLGFVFGSGISIAANVLYTWLPAPTQAPGWSPGLAPQIGAAVWPVALLISVEALSRVAWRPGWQWMLARYGGAGTVALGSGVISYGHLKGLLLAWGYGGLESSVGPLVIDGLMVISGFALLAMSPRQAGASR